MINRRGALAAMAGATYGALSSNAAIASLFRSTQGLPGTVAGTLGKDGPKTTVDARLHEDLARLASREYSDEGVPVFLACEDLVVRAVPRSPAAITTFNAALVADFRKTVEGWLQIHPDAPNTDVAKVIEVLADRDFAAGGKEHQP